MSATRAWLADYTWEVVTAQNAVLCAAKNALLKVRQDIHKGWGTDASIQLFSAPKRQGVEEAQAVLAGWMGLLEEAEDDQAAAE